MTISPASKVIISVKNYCQIVNNTFQKYTKDNLEDKSLSKLIIIDFKN